MNLDFDETSAAWEPQKGLFQSFLAVRVSSGLSCEEEAFSMNEGGCVAETNARVRSFGSIAIREAYVVLQLSERDHPPLSVSCVVGLWQICSQNECKLKRT